MSEEDLIRTGFGVLTESAPQAPSFDEIAAESQRPRLGRPFYAFAVVGLAAALVVLMVSLPSSLTPSVLAYSYPEGTYTYDISYLATHQQTGPADEGSIEPGDVSSTEAHGTLTYTVEEGPDPGTKTIGVQAVVSDVNSGDPTFQDIPEVRFVVDSNGGFVRALGPESGEGFPELVLPDPLPGSNLSGGLPFGFGPPFPDHPLDVGDSWTTSGPRSAIVEDGPQFTAEHKVLRTETIVERDTLVINSVYQLPARATDESVGPDSITEASYGPETAEVTAWFDPEAGIIVRAKLARATTSEIRFEDGQTLTSNGTTQIVVELTTKS
jgi:hypothetical protein